MFSELSWLAEKTNVQYYSWPNVPHTRYPFQTWKILFGSTLKPSLDTEKWIIAQKHDTVNGSSNYISSCETWKGEEDLQVILDSFWLTDSSQGCDFSLFLSWITWLGIDILCHCSRPVNSKYHRANSFLINIKIHFACSEVHAKHHKK